MSMIERVKEKARADRKTIVFPEGFEERTIQAAAELVKDGIRAIWNFAPTDLSLPDYVVQENVHLTESLMRLSYKLRASEEK